MEPSTDAPSSCALAAVTAAEYARARCNERAALSPRWARCSWLPQPPCRPRRPRAGRRAAPWRGSRCAPSRSTPPQPLHAVAVADTGRERRRRAVRDRRRRRELAPRGGHGRRQRRRRVAADDRRRRDLGRPAAGLAAVRRAERQRGVHLPGAAPGSRAPSPPCRASPGRSSARSAASCAAPSTAARPGPRCRSRRRCRTGSWSPTRRCPAASTASAPAAPRGRSTAG